MKELLEKLEWYKSNLSFDNLADFKTLIEDIKNKLPENYMMKFDVLTFFEEINENPFPDLPF